MKIDNSVAPSFMTEKNCLLDSGFSPLQTMNKEKTVKEEWRMKNEEWRMKNEEWKMKSEEWRVKNEKWRVKNEEWRMKSEEWKMIHPVK